MNTYKVLNKQIINSGRYTLVPIRFEDRYDIMKWRNEQIYHLRQNKPLTKQDQDFYFENTVSKLFESNWPSEILFSFLEEGKCIGYGGLVHINWQDKNAEISFIVDTRLEQNFFEKYWLIYLRMIETVAFNSIGLHKIFTYAFDLREQLYNVLLKADFKEEARLKQHCFFNEKPIDVLIHSKINSKIQLKKANLNDLNSTFRWVNDKKIRQYSFRQDDVSFENHSAWFFSKLNDENCIYFILYAGESKIGSIRIDHNIVNNEGLISYLIDSQFHGKGYGKTILILLEEFVLKELNIRNLILKGIVLKENIASIKIFKDLRYESNSCGNGTIIFTKKILL
jgi:RimJ/RimL family protein N-acetyltransferase